MSKTNGQINGQTLTNYEEYLLVKTLEQGSVPTNIKLIVKQLDDKVLELTGQTAKGLKFETIQDELLGVETIEKWLELGGQKSDQYEFDEDQKTEIESVIGMKFEEVESNFEVTTVIEQVRDQKILNTLLEDDYEASLQQSLSEALDGVQPGRIPVTPVVIDENLLNQVQSTIKTPKTKTSTPKVKQTKEPKIPSIPKPMINYSLHIEVVRALLEKIEHTMNFKDVTGVEMNWKEGRQAQFEREFHKLKRSTDSNQYFVRNDLPFEVDSVNATIFVMDNGPEFTILTFDDDFLVILDRNTKLNREKMNLVFAGSPTTESDKLSKILTRYKAAMTKHNGDVPGAIRW